MPDKKKIAKPAATSSGKNTSKEANEDKAKKSASQKTARPAERGSSSVGDKQRKIQREVDESEGSRPVKAAKGGKNATGSDGSSQRGARPKPPMPAQHQLKPGL